MVKLPNHKAVPPNWTEEDIRRYIDKGINEAIPLKLEEFKAKQKEIGRELDDWKSHPKSIEKVAEALNDLLFPLIFTGEDETYICSCQDCQNQNCTDKKSKNCNINRGFKKKSEKLKSAFQHKWKGVLTPFTTTTTKQTY